MVGRAKDTGGEPRNYHHGNLRQALVAAGLELARSGGPGAVLIRAVTREADVSHNAAYRHFANQEELLGAVAEQCMSQLGLLMIERADQVRIRGGVRRAQARLTAIGRAYIDFARTETGWFRTAFSSARAQSDDDLRGHELPVRTDDEETTNPFLILGARLDDLVEAGGLTKERRQGAEFFAWSAVHGLSCLLVDGPLRALPEPQAEYAIATVLSSISRGHQ